MLPALAALVLVLGVSCASVEPPGAAFTPGAAPEVGAEALVGPRGLGVTLVSARLTGRSGAREARLVLDSGSQSLVLPRALVEELSLPLLGRGVVNRGAEVSFHEAATVEVGPLVLRRPVVTAVGRGALGPLGELLGGEIDGFAGYPLFAAAVVEVRFGPDGGGDRVSLHEPGSYRLPSDSAWHPLELIDERPVVTARLSGGRELSLMIDTGTSGAVALDRRLARASGLLDGINLIADRRLTLHGPVTVATGRLPSLELAGRTYRDVALTVRPGDGSDRADLPEGTAGLVGRELFTGQTLVLDYPNRRFTIVEDKPNGHHDDDPGGSRYRADPSSVR